MAQEILQPESIHKTKDRGYSRVAKVGSTLYIAGQGGGDGEGTLAGKDHKRPVAVPVSPGHKGIPRRVKMEKK